MPGRPNILILMADQLTAAVLPAYGGRVARTPHIDALRGAGVVFDSFYCNSPLCAPSRFSFMAGQLPSRIGAYDNAAEFAAAGADLRALPAPRGIPDSAQPARCTSAARTSCMASRSG